MDGRERKGDQMGSYNRVILCGNLGRDAEVKFTPGGQAVGTFSVATTETWNDKQGQRQERTEWSRIVVWGKTAETLEPYLKKGKCVLVEGKLQTRKWEDKNGVERYTTEIKSDRIVLLGGGGDRSGGTGSGGGRSRARADDDVETPGPVGGGFDDDEPFSGQF